MPRADSPPDADEARKLLDSGWAIVLYRGELTDYVAAAMKWIDLPRDTRRLIERSTPERHITSNWNIAAALVQLVEKVLFGRIGDKRQAEPRPFAQLPSLPPDLSDAYEDFKRSILRHKLTGWLDVSRGGVLASLRQLEEIAESGA